MNLGLDWGNYGGRGVIEWIDELDELDELDEWVKLDKIVELEDDHYFVTELLTHVWGISWDVIVS